jgi:protein-S-isoprenylcysteine O-methyltransferase Ste14
MSETAAAPAGIRVRIGRFLFTYRNGIFPAAAVVMILCSRPRIFLGDVRYDWVLDAVGFAIALSGQALRAAVIGLAYIQRGGKNRKIDAPRLVRDGIFSLSRNPLYVGNILIIAGLVVIYNSPWIYAIVLPAFVFAYICIVAAEEEFLRGRFGAEYDDYCAEVHRFIPTPKRWRWVFHGASFDMKRVILKDYGSAFYWVSMAIALVLWKGVWKFGYEASRGEIAVLVPVWIFVLAAWGLARYVKKKRFWVAG